MRSLDDPRRARFLALVGELWDALRPEPEALPLASPLATPAPLIDKRELARTISVSVATIDRLDREGQPHVRIGDAKRYDVAAVLAWHRERPAPAVARPALTDAPAALSGVRRLSGARASAGRR